MYIFAIRGVVLFIYCMIGRQCTYMISVVGVEVWGVSPDGAATGADLGGSSKYSNENFED